jgi:LysM repeat protein
MSSFPIAAAFRCAFFVRPSWASALLALLVWTAPAQAERLALVVGNAAYADSPLKNPVNDARAMEAKLAALGFRVTKVENLKRGQIGRTLTGFANGIRPGDEVVVFYAGHGLQVKGVNYLPAVDADIQTEDDVALNSLNLNSLLDRLDEAKAGVKLLFLDACRNNPYARSFRSGSRGLARVSDAPSGTLMHYATRPGSVAADGSGANGLYTTELIKQIDQPGVPIEQLLKRVSAAVERASQGLQEPWVEGSLKGDFYFVSRSAVRTGSGFDLADLQQQSQAQAQQQEQAALARMQADHDKVVAFSGAPSLKVQAWERFLAAWADGQAGGDKGRTLARNASQQLALARSAANPAVSTGAPAAPTNGRYVVKPGDTLPRIALELGLSLRDLASWNNLANPNLLEVGQVLVLGPAAPAPESESINWTRPTTAPVLGRFDGMTIKGLQFVGRLGDPVTAAADGRVMYVGSGLRGYGNLIIIKHPGGRYVTAYAHNDQALVKENEEVRAGQLIARMGKSDADRVMLQFEIRDQGKPVDPAPFLGL